MTMQSNFAPEEWSNLLTAPVRAGMFISFSSFALTDSVKEMTAVAKALVRAAEQDPANELMGALFAEFKQNQKLAAPQSKSEDIEATKAEHLDSLRNTVALLDEKATPEEALAYKLFINQVAIDAANAAKEGGFLIFGGEQVNDAERAALAELANLLGVQPF